QERNYPESAAPSPQGPLIKDHTLKVELILKGLTYATDMAFLDPDNILVTEKDTGVVRRILNGVMLQKPLLDVNVATYEHRGMLGIAVSNNNNNFLCTDKIGTNNYDSDSVFSPKNANVIPKYVFLFYTAAQREDGEDITQGKQPLGNVVYRYEFVDNKLINPKLLLDLPSTPGAIGNGGKILVNPEDKNLYITIGGVGVDAHKTKAQNVKNGEEPDGTSGILVINQDGKPVLQNDALGNKDPLNKYYAYGIWNSFGVDFDPLTGKLWDTENGVIFGDEINLVYPGFNSGWSKIDGIWLRGYAIKDTEAHIASTTTINNSLLDFNGKGKYSPPEITWFNDVGPTAIRFFNSDKLGKQYENDIFIGDIINGNIYHFDLNKKRTELLFSPNSPLSDGVVSSNESTINDELALAKGFGGITDIEVGPKDGYLYILAFNNGEGTMYRIVPNNNLMQ
ncbi:MAG TPA: PQQ-dependent sugar dehydrogenase, partial [Nitrososphaeraceae archaeon]|nr:PQQ-dependent sugar dehydrogenase [Nitrososphaeraceae archaeon]